MIIIEVILLLYSCICIILGYHWDDKEKTEINGDSYRMIQYFGIMLVMGLIFCVMEHSFDIMKEIMVYSFNVFLNLALYDICLIGILPVLRKHFSASACAYLWMIPNYIYTLLIYADAVFIRKDVPALFLIYIPEKIEVIGLGIWVAGFLVVLIKIFYEDNIFRKELLKDSYTVDDLEILEIFQQLKHDIDSRDQIRLKIAPATKTPISIGRKPAKMIVFLPERNYTKEELRLIFLHELTHLGKNDCALKMFVGVTTAVFWFIPMSWIMKKRLTEDQELSCDEIVTQELDEEERKEYARLIIRSAGDERGFSTCLSATGESLRYRLANVVHPQKHSRIKNYILIGFVTIVLFVSCSCVEFSRSAGTMKEVLHTDSFELGQNDKEWQEYFQNTRVVKTRYEKFTDKKPVGSLNVRDSNGESPISKIKFYGDYIAVYDWEFDKTLYKVDNTSYKKLLNDK